MPCLHKHVKMYRTYLWPIKINAQLWHLLLHDGNVLGGPFGRVNASLNSCVLSWQSKGIPAHRMKDIVAIHFTESLDGIADGVHADMAHMQHATGVRKHGQCIVVGFAGIDWLGCLCILFPTMLPFGLYGAEIHGQFALLLLLLCRIVSRARAHIQGGWHMATGVPCQMRL